MSKPIGIRYRWNRENVENLFEASYRYLFEHSYRRYVGWFFIALLQYGVVVALKKEAFGIVLFATIVLGYWYYGKKWIAKRRAIHAFEHSPFRDQAIEFCVDDKGFTFVMPSQKHWRWKEIDEVVVLDDAIMLYKHPHFHYIPVSAFGSIEEKYRFIAIAKAKGRIR